MLNNLPHIELTFTPCGIHKGRDDALLYNYGIVRNHIKTFIFNKLICLRMETESF